MSKTTKKPNTKKRANSKPQQKGLSGMFFLLFCGILLFASYIYFTRQEIPTQTPPNQTAAVPTANNTLPVHFYFTNATTNKWENETRNIKSGEKTDMLRDVLTELQLGPKSTALVKPMNGDVKIVGAKLIDDGTAEVVFSEQFNQMTPTENAILTASLVYTLTELPFVQNVRIYVGESVLLKANGEPIGLLNRKNVMLNEKNIIKANAETQTIKLYFPDEQGLGLVLEERAIEINPNKPLTDYIIEELIAGPKSKNLTSIISSDTKLRSTKTEEGVCYVDVSSEFITKFSGGSTAEVFLVYSIVDSITELQGIKQVQILVMGDKIVDTRFSMDLSKPVERNEDVLIK